MEYDSEVFIFVDLNGGTMNVINNDNRADDVRHPMSAVLHVVEIF